MNKSITVPMSTNKHTVINKDNRAESMRSTRKALGDWKCKSNIHLKGIQPWIQM